MAALNSEQGEGAQPPHTDFFEELHATYCGSLASKTDSFEYVATEHLRMSGIYWGLSGKIESHISSTELSLFTS
jgi:prenyltransferase beta subunit